MQIKHVIWPVWLQDKRGCIKRSASWRMKDPKSTFSTYEIDYSSLVYSYKAFMNALHFLVPTNDKK